MQQTKPWVTSSGQVEMTVMRSPFGGVELAASDTAVVSLYFPNHLHRSEARFPRARGSHPVLAAAMGQLEEYFAGSRTEFDLPLAPAGNDFQLACWEQLLRIPYGETLTYGQQAARLGTPQAAQAVGNANGRNPISIIVPCHRVIGSDNTLHGYAGGLHVKRGLLELEGSLTAPLF